MSRFYADEDPEIGLALDPDHKKLGGVCAGIARYLDVETLWIRLIAIIALIVNAPLAIVAYVAACLLLDSRSDYDY